MQNNYIADALNLSRVLAPQKALNDSITQNATLFKLCLALYAEWNHANVHWREDIQPVADSEFPGRLNHYRRNPIHLNEKELQCYIDKKNTASDISSIMLWQSLHPEPLSYGKVTPALPVDVVKNSPYRVQQQLATENVSATDGDEAIDPTLLAQIIPSSNNLLV